MSKQIYFDAMKEKGKLDATDLQTRSAGMTGTELYAEDGKIPSFAAAVARKNMLERKVGFVCRSTAGRVVKLLQNYDSTVYPQEPEDLPAQWGFQWSTDPNHLPANFKEMSEWNGTYFTRKAMTVGPSTGEVIKRILASRKLEVQTYRMCQGVLGFTKKYSKQALEETCRQALELGKPNYSFIKNSIQIVAENLGVAGYNTAVNDERNRGAFVMGAESMNIERLLSRSQSLAQGKGKGGGK